MPVIPSHVFVTVRPEPHREVSQTPVFQSPKLVPAPVSGAVESDSSKSTFMPTPMEGVPSVKIEGRARVKYFFTPREP